MSKQATSTTTPATDSEALTAAHIESAPTLPSTTTAASAAGSASSSPRVRIRETVENGKTFYTGISVLRSAQNAAELIGKRGANIRTLKLELMDKYDVHTQPEITFENDDRGKATGPFMVKSSSLRLVKGSIKKILLEELEIMERIKVHRYNPDVSLSPILGKNFCILRAIEALHDAQLVLHKHEDGSQTLRISSSNRENTAATEQTIEDLLSGDLKAPALLTRVFNKNAVTVNCHPNIARRMYGKGSFVDLLTEHYRGDIQIYYFGDEKPSYWSIRGLTRELVQKATESLEWEMNRRKAEVEAIRAARKADMTAATLKAFADGEDAEAAARPRPTPSSRTIPGFNPHARRDVKPQVGDDDEEDHAKEVDAEEAVDDDVEYRVEGRRAYRPRGGAYRPRKGKKGGVESPAELAARLADEAKTNASSRRDSFSTTSSTVSAKLADAATTTTESDDSGEGPAAGGGGAAGGGASSWAAIAAKPGTGAKTGSSGTASGRGGARLESQVREYTMDDLDSDSDDE